MSVKCTVLIQKEKLNDKDIFVATCVGNWVASQGATIEEAMDNLKEALELYFEDNETPPADTQVFVTMLELVL